MKSGDRGCFRNSEEELPKVKVRLENLPRKEGARIRNQDGGVQGRALTLSWENTRITTNCWTIIERKTLELT